MYVTWECISINNRKVQVDTCADSTVISSKIWTELSKSQLGGKIRHLESYDGNQLTLLGSLICDVEWHRSRLTQKQLAVVQCDKKFGTLVREILHKHGAYNITTEHLPTCCKGLQSASEADIRITANVLHSQKKYFYLFKTRSQRSWNRWSDKASFNRYRHEESLMQLQCCGRERRVEN